MNSKHGSSRLEMICQTLIGKRVKSKDLDYPSAAKDNWVRSIIPNIGAILNIQVGKNSNNGKLCTWFDKLEILFCFVFPFIEKIYIDIVPYFYY